MRLNNDDIIFFSDEKDNKNLSEVSYTSLKNGQFLFLNGINEEKEKIGDFSKIY